MFVLEGHDNGLHFFESRDDVARCPTCGQLLRKWDENLSVVPIPRKLRFDVSASYDGVDVVSKRFRKIYEKAGLTGLHFVELSRSDVFAILARDVVAYDPSQSPLVLEDYCQACGQYDQVASPWPVSLKTGSIVPDLGFVRTDVEFGLGGRKVSGTSVRQRCGGGVARRTLARDGARAGVPDPKGRLSLERTFAVGVASGGSQEGQTRLGRVRMAACAHLRTRTI